MLSQPDPLSGESVDVRSPGGEQRGFGERAHPASIVLRFELRNCEGVSWLKEEKICFSEDEGEEEEEPR